LWPGAPRSLTVFVMTDVFQTLLQQGIKLRHLDPGRQYVHCPQCAQRAIHAHNRKARKLKVDIDSDGKILWYCCNCKWGGGAGGKAHARANGAARDEVDTSGNLASLKRRGWRFTQYDYTDPAGKKFYQNVRAELSKNGRRIGKTFRQRQPDSKGGWTENLVGIQQVPFRLHELLAKPGQDVHATEGEKDALTIAKLGLLSTSIASPEGVDLEVFGDRHVLVHEDNDPAGRSKSHKLAAALHGIATSVRIVRYTDAGDGGDVTDWLKNHDLEDLLTRCEEAPEWVPGPNGHSAGQNDNKANSEAWPDPDLSLVADDRKPAPAFDYQVVPPGWEDLLRGMSEDAGAPVDYVFLNLIAVASAVIGNARRVHPFGNWIEQPNLWGATVGNPSTKKTPALDPFKRACLELEKQEMPAHDAELRKWEKKAEAAKAAEDAWKEKVRIAYKNDRDLPDKPANATAPERPSPPRLLISDSTTEEAVNILSHNPRGLTLVRSELPALFGQLDRYGGAGADRGFYLECWDGRSHTVDRVKHKGVPVRVPFASLSIVGGIQPDKLHGVFAAPDDGLVARFLFIWPDPIPPRRPQIDGHNERAASLLTAFKRLRGLEMNRDHLGNPVPQIMRLDGEAALQLLETVQREVFHANQTERGLIAGWRGKNEGRLLRIALVIELLKWAASGAGDAPVVVSAESVKRAARYLDYATKMMLRCLGELAMTEAQRDAARLARLIRSDRMTELKPRALYSSTPGWHALRNDRHRKAVIEVLEEAGWIKHDRRGTWTVNPKAHEGADMGPMDGRDRGTERTDRTEPGSQERRVL
jgi:hypothetical protein